ncbi:alkanesulfonate monooxygenase SsuD/methylene tetrahydromethanopterin reductase-like flavin-dependent oxidoreductase (luciferase family) [Inquilinus ginsengisoli]|uniref:LLM class flavin-dependent oxidoreductase n=1 Tax=Inquilinus ginsengisoli TaxID=363840 RepID=UPI003D197814
MGSQKMFRQSDFQLRTIKFGVFDHLDDSGHDVGEQYRHRLDLAEACDRAGFWAYHVAEHHGTPHGLAPAPNMFLSAMAQRSSRLRLGPLVMLLNLYHPLRAFEEICMLDQLSGGRLDLGIGRGASPIEMEFFDVDPAEAQDRYREATEIILKAMQVDRLDHHGRYFDLKDVPITLSPVQRPHPPLWYGTAKPDSAAWAAEEQVNLACIGTASTVRGITDAYRSRWAETAAPGAAPPLLGMVRHVVIADSDREAMDLAGPAYARWADSLIYLHRARGIVPPPGLSIPFAEAVESGRCIAGSAATVRDALLRQAIEAGVSYVMSLLAFGDLPPEASLRTVASMQAEIMPAFEVPDAGASSRG